MAISIDDLTKIYNIVEIALTGNLIDVITMIEENKWFDILDEGIRIQEFENLVTLASNTQYFEFVVKRFPKNIEKCSPDYRNLYINLQLAKRKNKCFYYENKSHDINSLISRLYDGCIVKNYNYLYIIFQGDYYRLPTNNSGECYIPLNIAKKFNNPYTFFCSILRKNIITCIHLCPYVHRDLIEPMLKVNHDEIYFLYKNKITGFTEFFDF